MSQKPNFPLIQSAGSINNPNLQTLRNPQQEEFDSSGSRSDITKSIIDRLYEGTFIQRPGQRNALRTGGRKNKNEILGLTLARLIKEKHLNGINYSRNIELVRSIQTKVNNGSFVIIMRTDGRIVTMSDEVEQHLGKSMRSLYSQCINIFECLDETDGNKLQEILNKSSDLSNSEHRLICTFRLPKGKRPSRINEDIKPITMAGHFFSCDDSPSSETLFIARCEALISPTINGSSSSHTSMMASNNNDNTSSMVKITLNEDMSIQIISSNVKDILGYSRTEMTGNWFGRYLATDDLEKFEAIRQRYFQQQTPTNICEIFDIYANNGDSRLTFLCQIRPIRERRSKSVRFFVLAQLIDPSLRSECLKYVELDSETPSKSINAEQVNNVPSALPETSEDAIVANSPSLAMGLLRSDNFNTNDFISYQQPSPFHRSLSKLVAPVNINDQFWGELFDLNDDLYSTTIDLQYASSKYLHDAFGECQAEPELATIFNDYIDEYLLGDDLC